MANAYYLMKTDSVFIQKPKYLRKRFGAYIIILCCFPFRSAERVCPFTILKKICQKSQIFKLIFPCF